VNGKMLWFNEAKDHGFIEADTGERVYVHRSAFLDDGAPVGRCKGLPVKFTATQAATGDLHAAGVSVIPDADQRRATRHYTGRLR
jgi:cold shock CspA family protein